MNGWSFGADARAWGRAQSHSQYNAERPMFGATPSYSKNAFYQTDQGPKVSMGRRSAGSGQRYSGMTALSSLPAAKHVFGGRTQQRVSSASLPGPGAYSPSHVKAAYNRLHVPQPGTSAFVCGLPRTALPLLTNTCSEPGYGTLAADSRSWSRAGARGPQAQRFKRPPGTGSNLPSQKVPPAPGAYDVGTHSWPAEGFIGTARGFNHNR